MMRVTEYHRIAKIYGMYHIVPHLNMEVLVLFYTRSSLIQCYNVENMTLRMEYKSSTASLFDYYALIP